VAFNVIQIKLWPTHPQITPYVWIIDIWLISQTGLHQLKPALKLGPLYFTTTGMKQLL